VLVRPARPEDAAVVAEVHVRTWQAAYEHVFGAERLAAIDHTRRRTLAERAIASGNVDGILTLGPAGAAPALAALGAGGLGNQVKLATFDLSPAVLAAVRDGRMLFAIDQQPYLQGYLPVVLLAEEARHGLFPARGELVPTGPHFVTRANAAQALRLSRQGIR